MDLQISGRHVSVSDALREHTETQIGRLDKYADQIQRVIVTFSIDADQEVAEILVRVRRARDVIAEVRAENFHKALDLAMDKAVRQLRRAKDRTKEHRGRARVGEALEAAGEQQSADGVAEDEDL